MLLKEQPLALTLALKRSARLDWLKAASPENTCRTLSNVRCLSEGVDVPALDAVLFLNPRKSIIDDWVKARFRTSWVKHLTSGGVLPS